MKIDCSKTENYLKEKGRMIESIRHNCLFCPLASKHNGTGFTCCIFEGKYPDKAISIVQKWSDEHQRKTYKEDFFEKFPKANIKDDSILFNVCVSDLYVIPDFDICNECKGNCKKCWDMAMEE